MVKWILYKNICNIYVRKEITKIIYNIKLIINFIIAKNHLSMQK